MSTAAEVKSRRAQYNKKWAKANPDKIRAAHKRYRETHLEKLNKRSREWTKNNPEAKARVNRKWIENNPEQYRAYKRKQQQRARDKLSDSYVRGMLSLRTSLVPSDIPQELVDAKREHIKLHRKVKEAKA